MPVNTLQEYQESYDNLKEMHFFWVLVVLEDNL